MSNSKPRSTSIRAGKTALRHQETLIMKKRRHPLVYCIVIFLNVKSPIAIPYFDNCVPIPYVLDKCKNKVVIILGINKPISVAELDLYLEDTQHAILHGTYSLKFHLISQMHCFDLSFFINRQLNCNRRASLHLRN
ncbi:hypothetical protein DBV15_04607 [Temnothorax longispinosus]|uniref:Uncharacterized protein n=1 Tax=Temnothorax longispinosus TaxID=300112 RepID=A0A4S2L2I7_9HYME|nr:hypothetical protein DBV15_04607 [Temnothorax longispinosus]